METNLRLGIKSNRLKIFCFIFEDDLYLAADENDGAVSSELCFMETFSLVTRLGGLPLFRVVATSLMVRSAFSLKYLLGENLTGAFAS